MNYVRTSLVTLLLPLLITSCSWFSNDNREKPAPLPDVRPTLSIQEVWSAGPTSGTHGNYLELPPTIFGDVLYTVDDHGEIAALDKLTGSSRWSVDTKTNITTAVAASPDRLVVGTGYAQVLAMRPHDGKLVWFDLVSNEVLAKPVIVGNVLLIKSDDGHLIAYDVNNGKRLWNYEHLVPSLVLRGSSSPSVSRDTIIVGFDDGKVDALSLKSGRLLWQQRIANAEGATAVEQMVDIDASPLIVGDKVYVVSYQGNIASLNMADGRINWQQPLSSYTSMSYSNDTLFVTSSGGDVIAFARNNGGVLWKQTKLHARGVTGPVVMGNTVVVGDADGYLHWLDQSDGHFKAQTRVGHSPILAAPVLSNNMLYVVSSAGDVAAYRVK